MRRRRAPPSGASNSGLERTVNFVSFRLIPPLERDPRLVARVQSPLGKLVLLAVFTGFLAMWTNMWLEIALFIVLTALLPARRRVVLAAAALYFGLVRPMAPRLDLTQHIAREERIAWPAVWICALALLLVLGFFWVYLGLAVRFRRGWRRPVAVLHLAMGAAIAAAASLPLHGAVRLALWSLTAAFASYFWFFCYSLLDRASPGRQPYLLGIGAFRPLWMAASASTTPLGKGEAYLRKIEASGPKDLALAQLKGLKLLVWVVVLGAVLAAFKRVVYGVLAIPELDDAIHLAAAGRPCLWYISWASLITGFLASLLQISVFGNGIVACCRMCGFRALRNTWRPLEARSIADFWNRYYFYFKELLVDVYFYPAYLRYFKRYPRLRLAAATFCAACLGNIFFHFIRDLDYVEELGLTRAVAGFRLYALYCVLLAAGIVASQLRSTAARAPGGWFDRIRTTAAVAGFYCMLQAFAYTGRDLTLSAPFRFLGSLVHFWS